MTTKKPTINDTDLLTAAAKILAIKVAKWLDNGTSATDEQLIVEISRAIYGVESSTNNLLS